MERGLTPLWTRAVLADPVITWPLSWKVVVEAAVVLRAVPSTLIEAGKSGMDPPDNWVFAASQV